MASNGLLRGDLSSEKLNGEGEHAIATLDIQNVRVVKRVSHISHEIQVHRVDRRRGYLVGFLYCDS
jgi:hypothetical protein